ncbi:hypothetical protein [Streptomyces cinerochromogenes]|uniref:hypothetical protein n=1 Tax=Streptomyces cinerochromogenes TaxID=66422 RepID=UPI00339E0430
MGERHSGGGQADRRRAHPDGTLTAPAGTAPGESELETWFGAALRADGVDPVAERGAVAAFRAARAAGAHDARTRARDDWRPGRPRRSPRTALALALASLTLGGVAVAAIGSARSGTDDGGRHVPGSARPSSTSAPSTPSTPSTPADTAPPAAGHGNTPSPAPSGQPAHPARDGDTLARCRAYAQAGERGGALDATAWQRLVTAAGGQDKVAAYCTARAGRAEGGNTGKAAGSGDGRSESEGGERKGGDRKKPAGGKP